MYSYDSRDGHVGHAGRCSPDGRGDHPGPSILATSWRNRRQTAWRCCCSCWSCCSW